MSLFKEMDPELAWRAIEGHENVLTPEADKLDTFYKTFSCPRCKTPLNKEFDPRHMYADNSVMNARALLRCMGCRYLIDPHNNMVIEYGDPSKMPVETIPIINPE